MAETGAAKAIREVSGLSLAELAGAARVDKSPVWRWEQRRRRPRGEAALRYLAVLEELSQ